MVKLGFIVEGETERIILEKSDFFSHLQSLSINYVPKIVNADGSGNLLPYKIGDYTNRLRVEGATMIFILTDLDNDACITNTKNRIAPLPDQVVIVSVKTIESWFLSDTEAMRRLLKDPQFQYSDPQNISDPYEEIRSLGISKLNRGFGSKVMLAKTMVKNCNFSILNAARHPNCNSAKYFLEMISEVAEKK